MERHIDRVLALVDGEQTVKVKDDSQRCEVSPADASDVELLHAYSRAVVTVVEAVGPVVVSIVIDKPTRRSGMEMIGAGSGVIIASDGYILRSHYMKAVQCVDEVSTSYVRFSNGHQANGIGES